MNPLIRIQDLYKCFQLGQHTIEVLRGIDLEVYRGDFIAVVGASGAGKSTLLHIMGTLDRPSRGTMLFEGINVFTQSETVLAQFRNRKIGFVFQFHHLLPEFSALENTFLPALIQKQPLFRAREAAETLLREVGLGHRLHHKPGELSGGEQQRVAVARALIRNPELVLADEPTGNLDTHTGETLFALLREMNLKRGTAFVIVTHNEKLAMQTDRLIQLEDGRILSDQRLRPVQPAQSHDPH
ncbi:MAG: ABC transporter ATP-binding protein [Nitrospirae bacterium]|nr:MAG: ABC transporter ATP-binding protein [Nitrospirota bacterium]